MTFAYFIKQISKPISIHLNRKASKLPEVALTPDHSKEGYLKDAEENLTKIKENYFYEFFNGHYMG